MANITTNVGKMQVVSTCAPTNVQSNMAFMLSCGATITNTGRSKMVIQAAMVDQNGNMHHSEQRELPTNGSLTIGSPSTDMKWAVAGLTKNQAEDMAFDGLGIVGGVLVFAGIGAYATIKGIWHKLHGSSGRRYKRSY